MLHRPRMADGVVVRDIRDEICVMQINTGEVLVLNQTDADIWLLASDGLDGAAVVSKLSSAYGVSAVEILSQVTSLLETLEQRGFLVDAD